MEGGALGIVLVIALIMLFESDSGSKKKSDVNIFEWLPMDDPNRGRKRRK